MTAWVADIYPTLIVAGLSHTLLLKPQRPSSDDARYQIFEIRQSPTRVGSALVVSCTGRQTQRYRTASPFNPDVFYNVCILIWNNLAGVHDQRIFYRNLSIAFLTSNEIVQELKEGI
jgi:hypothetical protein